MKEIWKPIEGFEQYEISNKGRIKRIKINRYSFITKEKESIKTSNILKPTIDRNYLKIKLSVDGKTKLKYIHRLVAEAFIPNPNNFPEVNHKDNDPSNNSVENLEWCDRKYNIDYMLKHQEEIKERHEMRIETLEDIYYGIENGIYKSLQEVKERIDKNLLEKY